MELVLFTTVLKGCWVLSEDTVSKACQSQKCGSGLEAHSVTVPYIADLPDCKAVMEIKHSVKTSLTCPRCVAEKDTFQEYTVVRSRVVEQV